MKSLLELFPRASKGLAQYVCNQCRSEFIAQRSAHRKFCSPNCAYINETRNKSVADKQRKDRGFSICNGCGVKFRITTVSGKAMYCSQKCAASHIGRKTLLLNRPVKPAVNLINKTCPTCQSEFTSWKSSHRKFCSPKCSRVPASVSASETMHRNGHYKSMRPFSRCKKGLRPDLGLSFRSSWEANYARFLNWLKKNDPWIYDWEYEPTTFWFHNIKRGCRSWLPDFKVTLRDGSIEYHEVKGWMYPRSKTALRRMRIYYPDVSVVLIDQNRYKALQKQMRHLIPEWEA